MDRFTLVRHAEASGIPAADPDLTSPGYRQAERIAARLAGECFSQAWSSTQARAMQTAARVLAFHPGTPLLHDEDLCEIDRIVSAAAALDEVQIVSQLSNQVRRWQDRLGTRGQQQHILVVAHAGPLRVLLCHLLDLPAARHWSFRLDPASITRVHCAPGLTTLTSLNDCCHLEKLHDD